MNPVISIRAATEKDNIVLAQLGWETFNQAFAAGNTPEDMAAFLTSSFSPELQAAELADPLNIFWLVYADELPVGYVKMNTGPAVPCITQSKSLKIARLYILQTWCGRGIGSNLLRRCLQYALEKGFASVWLTVWEHNPGALALYQKMGFKIVGDEDFVLGQDVQHDFVMEKVIN